MCLPDHNEPWSVSLLQACSGKKLWDKSIY
uniref:Superoxide dismutase n=1 Tax=Siphoviridae sp. ctmxA102 TaxID=2825657 RepID=A0A8S5TVX9_9CAUD|nr:MAG TPA: superoxide dismutase [Siphoviridae sp. ctmxA102]